MGGFLFSYFCGKCDKRFIWAPSLNAHTKRKCCKKKKGSLTDDNKCYFCNRTFHYETNLKKHEEKLSHKIASALLN